MTQLVRRRSFLKLSAAAAVMGATPLAWAKQTNAPEQRGPVEGLALNDYLVAEFSMAALAANLASIRRELKPSTKLCAVVKTNCYGHGWLECKDTITAAADWLAVARPEEALAVRQSGCRLPTLLLMASGLPGEMASDRLRQLIAQDITLTVAAPNDLAAASAVAAQLGRTARVHIKIDTGMSRSGVLAHNAPALIRQARQQSGVTLTGLYTHFAEADAADKTSTREQLGLFLTAIKACGDDANGLMLHSANSGATIDLPETHFDMVRPGVAMYGYQPSDEMHKRLPLRPIFRLVGRVAQVKDVPAGAYVGYGRTYRFDRPARVGLMPIGYADGYCRAFSNRAVMRIQGRVAPVRGRVSMDQTVIDLTGTPDVKIGDEVEIVSNEVDAPNSVENLAKLANTIPHEFTCKLGARIRRLKRA